MLVLPSMGKCNMRNYLNQSQCYCVKKFVFFLDLMIVSVTLSIGRMVSLKVDEDVQSYQG